MGLAWKNSANKCWGGKNKKLWIIIDGVTAKHNTILPYLCTEQFPSTARGGREQQQVIDGTDGGNSCLGQESGHVIYPSALSGIPLPEAYQRFPPPQIHKDRKFPSGRLRGRIPRSFHSPWIFFFFL